MKYSPSDEARIYKSLTVRELFSVLPWLRKRLWGGEFWSNDFFVETVGQRGNCQALLRYIKKQGQKPKKLGTGSNESTSFRLMLGRLSGFLPVVFVEK